MYQFSWKSGGNGYDGVGVQTESSVGVAFSSGAAGKACSVVHYKVGANGALAGRWGAWGNDASGNETATRSGGGSGLDGKYDVSGSRLDGAAYKGTLNVSAQGAGYLFSWSTGDTSEGFGVRMGDFVSVGIERRRVRVRDLRREGGWDLERPVEQLKSKAVGTEIATKKK